MKNYKLKIILALILFSSLTFNACYEENNWLADHAELTGKHYPIIQGTSVDASSYNVGDIAKVTSYYWSIDEVDRIELYASIDGGEEKLYTSVPYTHKYNEETRTDQVDFDYTVPEGTKGSTITLRVVVVCKNGLTSREESITQKYKYDRASFTVNE